MKRKNISELDKMFPNRFPNTSGIESLVFYLKYIVYKEFTCDVTDETLKRKEQKLLELETFPQLQPYYPQILYLIDSLLNEYIRGYIMKPIRGKSISKASTFEIKMKALEDLKKILALFRNTGFLYLDIRQPNIKLDSNKNIKLLDIDSIVQIDNPILDCTPTEIKLYLDKGGKINTNAQIFMFNVFTQSSLDLTKSDVDKTGRKMLEEFASYDYTPDSAIDHEYLTEHIKRK